MLQALAGYSYVVAAYPDLALTEYARIGRALLLYQVNTMRLTRRRGWLQHAQPALPIRPASKASHRATATTLLLPHSPTQPPLTSLTRLLTHSHPQAGRTSDALLALEDCAVELAGASEVRGSPSISRSLYTFVHTGTHMWDVLLALALMGGRESK